MATFGERLRELRLAAGLSQSDLAGDDLSASYISLMEAGKRSPSDEVVHQLARRLECSPSRLMDGKPSEREERVELEIAFARLAVEHGEAPEARRRLERLLADDGLSEPVRDEISYRLGIAYDRCGDPTAAVRVVLPLFERACGGLSLLLVHELGMVLCGCYRDAGDLGRAIQIGELALERSQALGLGGTDEYFRLVATVMWAYLDRGDFVHARVWAEQVLEQAQAAGRRSGQAALYWNLGLLAEHEGRQREALRLYEHALANLGELDDSRDFARLRTSLAIALLHDDPPQLGPASNVLSRAADDIHDLGGRTDQSQWNWAMAVTFLHQGDITQAEMRARQALDLARDDPAAQADALQVMSDCLAAQNRDEAAARARLAALSLMREFPQSRTSALGWRELAERLAGDDPSAALEAFRRALDAAGVPDRGRVHRAQVAALRARPEVPAVTS